MFEIYHLLFLSLFVGINGISSELEIETSLGSVKGRYFESQNGRIFRGFTAIPYAKSPVGKLRFEAPVAPDTWTGVLDATNPHEVCPQMSTYLEEHSIIGNEDCLYLNVYAPSLTNGNAKLLPVMVYIHGGAFIKNSARHDWLGPELLLDKDIVLVTVNYRLGSLGFLTTGDKVVPGNNGLKDQSLALVWVKNNIESFGGDSHKITLFGNSAGATAIQLHLFSPLTKNIVDRAIIQSSHVYPISDAEQGRRIAFQLGADLNCPSNYSSELVECLKKVDITALITQQSKFVTWNNESNTVFLPVVEHESERAFLSVHPGDALKNGGGADIPLMFGIVSNETAFKTAGIIKRIHHLNKLDTDFLTIVPSVFGVYGDKELYATQIREFYFGSNNIDSSMGNELNNMLLDGFFSYNLHQSVKLHSIYSKQSVYQYLFDYRGSVSYSSLYGDSIVDYGTCHTDELLYLFKLGRTYPNYQATEEDKRVSELMTTLWVNFADTGIPTSKWDPVITNNLKYYHIKNHNNTAMAERLFWGRMQFWKNIPALVSIFNNNN